MFGIFLVTVVAVLGGVIAFVGDRVGMRVGRKRLSLFGLRPKYTSMAVAILTGVLTATCTLGILSAASENVRIAVFSLSKLRKDLSAATDRYHRLKTEYGQVEASLADVTAKWRTARTELAGINSTLAALHGKISTLTTARERTERTLALARQELDQTGADLAKVKGQYAQVMTELASARDEVKFYQQRRENLESMIDVLQQQIEALSSQREFLGTGVVDFASQTIILHKGEILASRVVEPGGTFAEVEEMVHTLLNEADRIARERGATIQNKTYGTKVDLYRLTDAYKALFDLQVPVVLRVASEFNTIAGRPAFVYLEALPDAVLFHQGETIARILVKGNDQDLIFFRLINELLPAASQAAIAEGMTAPDGGAPVPRVGPATLEKIAAEAAALGQAEIRLIALRDLRRAGEELSLTAAVDKVTGES